MSFLLLPVVEFDLDTLLGIFGDDQDVLEVGLELLTIRRHLEDPKDLLDRHRLDEPGGVVEQGELRLVTRVARALLVTEDDELDGLAEVIEVVSIDGARPFGGIDRVEDVRNAYDPFSLKQVKAVVETLERSAEDLGCLLVVHDNPFQGYGAING